MSLVLATILVTPAWGFSGQQRLRIPLSAPQDAKQQIDSIAQDIYGISTAQWNARRHCLFLVYDRTKTTQKDIITTLRGRFQKKSINFALGQDHEPKKQKQ
ncbi:MAG: hypothetical protein PUD15_00510 [Prevotella sp.]|nr:hypothetical protein [Prevotella sp.]